MTRTSSSDRSAGSGMSQSSTVVGTYGQVAPHARVIAQSAWSCISTVSFFGRVWPRSTPTSRMASTTTGHTPSRRGCCPADSARMSPGAMRLKNASAICDRPALCVHTNSTFFMTALLDQLGRDDQLVGELGGQSDGAHLVGHGVVLDPLDRDRQLACRGVEHRKGAARVAVLGLADRAAVDEQDAPVLAHPRLVGVPEDQHIVALRCRESLTQRCRLVLEQVLVDLARRAVDQMDVEPAEGELEVERELAHEGLGVGIGVGERPLDGSLPKLA